MAFSSVVIGGLAFYLVIAVLVFIVVRSVTADIHETIAWRAFRIGYPIGAVALLVSLATLLTAVGRPVGIYRFAGLQVTSDTVRSVGLWVTGIAFLGEVGLIVGLIVTSTHRESPE